MTRESLLILIGTVLALSPFLGIPHAWLIVVVPILALTIVLIGVTLRIKRSRASSKEPVAPPPYEPEG